VSGWLEAKIAVGVPVAVAYECSTRFEDYPDFVPSLTAVQRLGGDRLRFVAELSGERHEWGAQITDAQPHHRLRVQVTERVRAAAVVRFSAIKPGRTQVHVEVEYDLDPLRARLLEMLVDPQRQLEAGLERFKETVENGSGSRRTPARARRAASA
jgi:uncharacterized membrane protein